MDVVKDSNSKEDTCNSIVESSAPMVDYRITAPNPNLGTCSDLGLDLGFYDSGFIQRAARFSCFGEMMNPCSEMHQHKNDVLSKEASLPKQNDQSNETPTPTPTQSSETKQKADQDTMSNSKPKEEYIHVRARRGQATNSHSLAERVRREKISERMKFLQDLVPGCSKVTGKAVMLDEIINYVQSLQRQVEFLSMKLATVNPRLDFNIEGLLQPRAGISSSLGLLPEMAMPFPPIHPPQGLIHPEAIRRSIPSVCGGSKDPFSQVSNVWEDELHNIVQMGFNLAPPPTSQDLSSICTGSLPPGHMKAEP